MPFVDYLLLALLASNATATPSGTPENAANPLMRTLTAEVVTQPVGGTAGLPGQDTGGSTDSKTGTGKKPMRNAAAAKHYRKGRHHTRVITTGKKPANKI